MKGSVSSSFGKMFLAESNTIRNLLHLSFVGRVKEADLQDSEREIQILLAQLKEGFCLLSDLSQLESMQVACESAIGRIMDLCKTRGIGRIVRVIPDPKKDIGLSILTRFHYGRGVRVTTCKTLEQACKILSM